MQVVTCKNLSSLENESPVAFYNIADEKAQKATEIYKSRNYYGNRIRRTLFGYHQQNKRTAEKSAHWIFHGILDGRYAGWMVAWEGKTTPKIGFGVPFWAIRAMAHIFWGVLCVFWDLALPLVFCWSGFFGFLLVLTYFWPSWGIWAILLFVLTRFKSAPLSNEEALPLKAHKRMGFAAIVIFLLTFVPVPIKLVVWLLY